MKKKKILALVSWYPSTDNTVRGGFFRERFQMLSKYYDFSVLQVDEYGQNPFSFFLNNKIKINEEFLLQDPNAYYVKTKKIKDNKFLYLLPYFIYKRIKKINHFYLKRAYFKAVELIIKKGFKPDLIYATSAQTCGSFALYLSNKLDIPYVISEHSNFYSSSLNRIDTRKALEEAGAVISISHDKTRQFLFNGVKIKPIYVGNPVDGDRFILKPDRKNKKINILTVASYTWVKDYETYFKTITELNRITNKPFKATVVGIGKKNLKLFIKKLEEYQIREIVEIIPLIEREKIVNIYHMSDVFLLTSIAEGMSNSVLEALSCGIPVYSTICGGSEDLIDGKNGRLFHLQDYKSIASSLKEFIEGKINFDKNYIRSKVIENYGREVYERKMTAIFDNLLKYEK